MSWRDYSPGAHRCFRDGYRSPEIVQSAAEAMADGLRTVCREKGWDRSRVVFVVADGSSAVIGAHVMMAFGAGRIVTVCKGDGDEGTESGGHYLLMPEVGKHIVFCDDYICGGTATKAVSRIIDRPIDLVMTIDATSYAEEIMQGVTHMLYVLGRGYPMRLSNLPIPHPKEWISDVYGTQQVRPFEYGSTCNALLCVPVLDNA